MLSIASSRQAPLRFRGVHEDDYGGLFNVYNIHFSYLPGLAGHFADGIL
jgi:hypothetical protein